MSNQIVITSGAKVRNLDGVLTGTSGIVGSVGFGTANGVATLDSSGKVPLSQLPASVITYLGTWNAATNTPTLTNGVGDVGDLYICNVAGTVNFGAGPITFAVGDWVIYSGTTWEKSGGASGTVTSVAMTVPTGLSVTGSPITTSGTLAVSLSSGYTIPTTSFLSGLVPYTGATQTVDLGSYDLNARGIKINGTGGLGHADFKHQSGTPTGSASSTTMFADTNGNMAWKNDHNYITTLASNSNTADRTYTFPDANGTIALTSDISYPVTSVFGRTGAVTAQSGDYTTTQVTEGTNLYFTDARARGAISLTTSGSSGAATYNSTTGVLNVPNYGSALSGYVPYTGATSQVDLGSNNLYGKSLNVWGDGTNGGGLNLKQYTSQSFLPGYGYTAVFTDSSYGFGIWFLNSASTGRQINFNASLLANNTGQTYYLPAATGTIALTSDIPSLANYVTTNTNQTISGIKTFSNEQLFGNGITLTGGYITYTSGAYNLTLNTNLLTANRNVFIKDGSGTLAFTSDIPSLSGYVQGSGTTNYHAKFTGTSTIGNSMLTDDGTTLQSIGATRSNLYLKAASNSYYSQLAFTNGSNGSFGGLSYNSAGQFMQFEANSSEWMRMYANGNVRIFTSSATDNGSKFQVEGDIKIDNGAADGGQLILASSGFSDWNLDNFSGRFRAYYNTTEYLTILANGNVGIGTSSPNTLLHIYGTTPSFTLTDETATGNNGTTSIRAEKVGVGYNNLNYVGYTHTFKGGGSESTFLTINTAGAATFSSSVTASGSFISNVTNGYGLRLNRAAVTNYNGISHATGGVEKWFVGMRENLSSNNYVIYNEATGADAFTISTSNNSVGIGTNDPSAGYAGTIANVKLALRNGTVGASSGTSVLLIGGDNNHYSSITAQHIGGGQTYLAFGVSSSVSNPTERMRISTSGNLLIGKTTDDGYPLQVNGTISVTGTYGLSKVNTGAFFPVYMNGTLYYFPVYA